ncbi:spermidine synthase [Parvibium lacunae]|uniref:Spermidine synthase n=1 Tax=Parvibium lacunae TaxID=1888893 RepID=A0A368L3X4_9BURK|nr:spermidine synthase [Parvibium lacunae]
MSNQKKTPRTPLYAPVTFSEQAGVRYLHFGTEWVQGAMRLRKPFKLELEYAQQMMAWLLFLDAPQHVAQLGLGAASLTKACWQLLPQTAVTAVELNPDVIACAHSMFALPPEDDRLTVLEQDAAEWVAHPKRARTVDVLQVDLYDATARGPVLESLAFYQACRRALRRPGMLTVNLFGDHPSFVRNLTNLRAAFDDRVLCLPEVHQGNVIALAFNGPALEVSWEALYQRALAVEAQYDLPARKWVKGLHQRLQQMGSNLAPILVI